MRTFIAVNERSLSPWDALQSMHTDEAPLPIAVSPIRQSPTPSPVELPASLGGSGSANPSSRRAQDDGVDEDAAKLKKRKRSKNKKKREHSSNVDQSSRTLTAVEEALLGPSFDADGRLRIMVKLPWLGEQSASAAPPSPTPSSGNGPSTPTNPNNGYVTSPPPSSSSTTTTTATTATATTATTATTVSIPAPKPKRRKREEQIDPMSMFGENPLIPQRLPANLPRIPKRLVRLAFVSTNCFSTFSRVSIICRIVLTKILLV